MAKTQPAAGDTPAQASPPAACDPSSFAGFAGRVPELKDESMFLRSLFSIPTEVINDEGTGLIYPFGDDRVIFPRNRQTMTALGLSPGQPQERFPAVSRRDGAGNVARDYLRGLIAEARSAPGFSDYEVRLAVRRIGSPGLPLTPEVVVQAYGDAADSQTALTRLIDHLWSQEDSLCRRLCYPIPPPIASAEV